MCYKPDVGDGGARGYSLMAKSMSALLTGRIQKCAKRATRSRMRRRVRFSISLIQLADLGSQLSAKDRSKVLSI